MDDVRKRLQDAADSCIKAHKEWSENEKDNKVRENLMECVHELRKVAARLEIDLAISERDQMGNKPIPIPSHRSNPNSGGGKGRGKGNKGGAPKNNDGGDNNDKGGADVKVENKPGRRRASNNKSE